MRCTILSWACLLLLTPAFASAQEVDGALASAVRISGTRNDTPVRGSGFVVAVGQGVATVVTASHVIEGTRFEVVFTASATEQSQGIGEVNIAVGRLDQMTQQNAALVEESAAAAESLREQARRLAEMVGSFRIQA